MFPDPIGPKHGWVSIPVVLEMFGVPRKQKERGGWLRLSPPRLLDLQSPSPYSNSYHVHSQAKAGLTNTSEVEHAVTQGTSFLRPEV